MSSSTPKSNFDLIPFVLILLINFLNIVSAGKDKGEDIIIIGGGGGDKGGGGGGGGGGGMPLILITGDDKKKKGGTILIIFPQKPHHHHHFVESHGSYGGGGGGGASYGGGGGGGGYEAPTPISYEMAGKGGDEYASASMIRMLSRGGGSMGSMSSAGSLMSGSESRPIIINAANGQQIGGGQQQAPQSVNGMSGFGGMDSTYDLSSYGQRNNRPSYFGGISAEESNNSGVRFITI